MGVGAPPPPGKILDPPLKWHGTNEVARHKRSASLKITRIVKGRLTKIFSSSYHTDFCPRCVTYGITQIKPCSHTTDMLSYIIPLIDPKFRHQIQTVQTRNYVGIPPLIINNYMPFRYSSTDVYRSFTYVTFISLHLQDASRAPDILPLLRAVLKTMASILQNMIDVISIIYGG